MPDSRPVTTRDLPPDIVPPDIRDLKFGGREPGGTTTPAAAATSAASLSPARNVAFFATVTDDAITYFCRLPKSWKAAFSADPAYPVTDQQINAVKASGHEAYAWCDCRTTLPPDAIHMKNDLGLAGWYGQAESAAEFSEALDFFGKPAAIIGNLSALEPDQLAKVASGEVLFIQETYYNVQPDLKPDWRGANLGVGGNCWAFYASESEGAVYTPVDSRFKPERDSVYCEGMTEADWKAIS